MNQAIRNKLRNVVTRCRKLLEDAVAQVLQGQFGIYATGKKDEVHVEDESRMTNLVEEEDRVCRRDLLDHFEHIQSLGYKPTDALAQLVREVGFTHLNRLCAYKMMEARGVVINGRPFREAVSRGRKSQGFLFYLADHPEDEKRCNSGRQDVAYRHFLDWLGGTLSEEIGVLFSPNDPANRLYPPQRVLDDVLDLINTGDIKPDEKELQEAWPTIWRADETIGWVYQYFTPKELRDQARKESAAPRNSYELAFRNQFFTPRYVVEFLTDNTLGRIWYEMRKGQTRLREQCRYMIRRPNEVFLAEGESLPSPSGRGAGGEGEDLSQEDLLKLPAFIPHRPKKDPRELRILDPACGSGHFLLYCFDLLETIYEEAYDDLDLSPALKSDYPTRDDLRRAVPGMILAYNLHGIDIDLRATQIAALALWLRCHRAYQEREIKKERPRITKSNIVCAEPMPGEKEMLKEFVADVQPGVLGHLVEVVFDKMQSAGEAGSLLKVEEELREAIATAKRQWATEHERAVDRKGRAMLFSRAEMERVKNRSPQPQLFDISEITEEQFWNEAESRVLATLRDYASHASNGGRLRRQLFAEDAAHGFAFVDLCQKRFDVLLMNPPFGIPPRPVFEWLQDASPVAYVDLYTAFLVRCGELSHNGLVGVISSRSFLMTPRHTRLREEFLLDRIRIILDLGPQVMDEAEVESAAYIFASAPERSDDILACNLRFAQDKQAVIAGSGGDCRRLFSLAKRSAFRTLPGCRLFYNLPERVHSLLRSSEVFEPSIGTARCGGRTFDDFRFLRSRWEVPATSIGQGKAWIPFCKGGEFAPYYGSVFLLIKWENDGEEIAQKNIEVNGQTAQARQASTYYFRSGLTYSQRSKGFAVRVMPKGCIFSSKGPAVLSESTVPPSYLVGWLNSRLVRMLVELQANKYQFDTGIIKRLPWCAPTPSELREFSAAGTKLIDLARQRFVENETDPYFSPRFVRDSLRDIAASLNTKRKEIAEEIAVLTSRWDRFVDDAYGLDSNTLYLTLQSGGEGDAAEADEAEDDSDDDAFGVDSSDIARNVLSFTVGACFGRWDYHACVGDKPHASLPDAFSPLPLCPPAMRQDGKGLPATLPPGNSPLRLNWDGILPDDPDHADDIVRCVREVLELAWRDRAEAIEKEACELLGIKQIRDYFRKSTSCGFWDDHIKRYSKSRRKAPIYWLLQSSKKNYAIWLYYHRLDKDILFKALLHVETKIRLEENELATMRAKKGAAGKGAKNLDKDIEKQENFLSELRDFEDKLRRAANLHLEPDLNDGVVLNIAPLWELVPWREAKDYWEELLEGKYEWSSIGKQLREKGLVK